MIKTGDIYKEKLKFCGNEVGVIKIGILYILSPLQDETEYKYVAIIRKEYNNGTSEEEHKILYANDFEHLQKVREVR